MADFKVTSPKTRLRLWGSRLRQTGSVCGEIPARTLQATVEIYAHLIEQRYNLEVSVINLYYTGEEVGMPTCRFSFERQSVDATITGIDAVVGCMEKRKIAMKERPPKLCKECGLKPYCDREGC